MQLAMPAWAQTPASPGGQTNAATVAAPAAQSSSAVLAPDTPEGFFPEPGLLTLGIEYINDRFDDTGQPESGFYPEFSNMITGAGWISAGPGYRQYMFNRQLLFDTSAAISWRLYLMGQARIEAPELANDRLTIGFQTMWQDQTQVNFFGIGPDAVPEDKTHYRLQPLDYVGYAEYRPTESLSIDGTLGFLPHPKLMNPGGTFKGDTPSTLAVFPDVPAANLSQQPDFLHSTVGILFNTLDFPSHPTRGSYNRAAVTLYSDRSTGTFTFQQYEAQATQFVPLMDRRWVLAFRGWVVSSQKDAGDEIPFYLLPSIGGHNTLRDYHNFQFHDNNSLVVNAESRWSVFTHMDGAVFVDAGNVAARFSDLNLDKISYGAGVRLHTGRATIARFDVAHGPQGWKVFFRTNDPMRLTRGRRHVASIAFTP
jgi:hypothetical protein